MIEKSRKNEIIILRFIFEREKNIILYYLYAQLQKRHDHIIKIIGLDDQLHERI